MTIPTFLRPIVKVCKWLSECTVRESDSEEDALVKRVAFPLSVVMTVSGTLWALLYAAQTLWLYAITSAIGAVGCAGFVMGAKWHFVQPAKLADVTIIILTVVVCGLDAAAASLSRPREWMYVVLLLDLLLVCHRYHVTVIVVCTVLVYLAVERLEAMSRFGLYDLGYWGASTEDSACNCPSPPCSIDFVEAGAGYAPPAIVFVADFVLTRGFATGLRDQLRAVQSSVDVAANIAAALANYDVEGAASAIQSEEALPKEMAEPFRMLVANLRSYKAYLPHSCLVREAEASLSPSSHSSSVGREGTSSSKDPVSVISPQGSNPKSNPRWSTGPKSNPRWSTGSLISDTWAQHNRSKSRNASIMDRRESVVQRGMARAKTRRVRGSLAAGNMTQYLSSHDDLAGAEHREWMSEDVEAWCKATLLNKGVVDLVSGDRRCSSFNARVTCAEHANAAIHLLFSRPEGSTGAVVTGQAVCGDFGSHDMIRFMVLGAVSKSFYTVERVAAAWKTAVLIDNEAHGTASFHWEALLIGAVRVTKRDTSTKMSRLFNVTARKEELEHVEEEWMYRVGNMQPGKHAEENEAVEKRIKDIVAKFQSAPQAPCQSGPDSPKDVLWNLEDVGLSPVRCASTPGSP
eukprot:Hpha_TRINITY_DN11336_c0_g1::TRINITY_DN11336_c0_g1_i1::g.62977::m.62977